MRPRSPQEKKRLSYERDRRNVYGRSPHASRKRIPLRKALRNRAIRHYENQQLAYQGPTPSEDLADHFQSLLHQRVPNGWQKEPDAPLGEVIARKSRLRAVMRRHGGRNALRTIRRPMQTEE